MEGIKLSAKQCLEFSKKIAVLQKLLRMGLLEMDEYILVKNRIMDSYHISEQDYFPKNKRAA